MDCDRRTFLQSLLTWGVSQTGLRWFDRSPQWESYYQTLAAPTQRKLALLVGIDEYGDRLVLKGCTTDVERQRELLLYRFGFGPSDILTLTNQQATRQGIETAFEEHLVKQARPGDVVLFHFSGYGCQVNVEPHEVRGSSAFQRRSTDDRWLRGFVPSDGTAAANDLLEDTLLLLGRSLETEKFTFVLDASHQPSSQPLQGNLRVRSLPYLCEQPNAEELALQAQLKRRLTEKSSANGRTGIVLSAAGSQQIATELSGQGFSVGLFTYALTQYLWQVTPASKVSTTLARTTEQVAPLMGEQQQPQQHNGKGGPLFTYYLLPATVEGAEALITRQDDETSATIKLTGLPATLLKHYGLNSCFDCLPALGEELPLRLQLRSRTGLTGKVRPLTQETAVFREGQLLQEAIRCLPRDIKLSVALESHLERIERVDATSAFSTVAAVAEVITAGEKEADCLLGRVPVKSSDQAVVASESAQKTDTEGYGLLSAGGILLPNTAGSSEEAIKSAVKRLTPTLNQLLAAKLWNLTANEGSSQLAIRVILEMIDERPRALIQRRAGRLNLPTAPDEPPLSEEASLAQLPRDCRLQYRLVNQSDRPIYFLLLGIDASAQALLYLPSLGQNDEVRGSPGLKSQGLSDPVIGPSIPPGETYLVPSAQDNLSWHSSALSGLEQFQAIASHAPFTQTWQALRLPPELKRDKAHIFPLNNPLAIAQSLLQDLHMASGVPAEIVGSSAERYALDVRAWATLSFVYQVV